MARGDLAGQSSTTHGYTTGGDPVPTGGNVIDKFPFSTDANATDVGDLTVARRSVAGQSSATHGYATGGLQPSRPPAYFQHVIDKFPFSTDANATDVGDLTVGRRAAA